MINLKHVVCPHSGVLFIKLNDALAHATQQMNLEHIMVQAKRAEHRRSMTCVISCRQTIKSRQIKTESRGQGKKGENHCFLGTGLLFKAMKPWKWVMVTVRGHWVPSMSLKLTFKIHVYFGLQ